MRGRLNTIAHAAALGLTENAVKIRLHRARQALAKILGSQLHA